MPPTIYPANDELIQVTSHTEVTLKCEASGFPQPNTVWSADNNQLDDKNYYKLIDKEQLKLFDVTPSKSNGQYTCNSQNTVGTIQKKFTIIVKDPPKILTKFSSEYKILPNKRGLSINCEAFGNPKPTVKWTRNGAEVIGDEVNGAHLYLTSNQPELSGYYECVAENSQGIDKKGTNVMIIGELDAFSRE